MDLKLYNVRSLLLTCKVQDFKTLFLTHPPQISAPHHPPPLPYGQQYFISFHHSPFLRDRRAVESINVTTCLLRTHLALPSLSTKMFNPHFAAITLRRVLGQVINPVFLSLTIPAQTRAEALSIVRIVQASRQTRHAGVSATLLPLRFHGWWTLNSSIWDPSNSTAGNLAKFPYFSSGTLRNLIVEVRSNSSKTGGSMSLVVLLLVIFSFRIWNQILESVGNI